MIYKGGTSEGNEPGPIGACWGSGEPAAKPARVDPRIGLLFITSSNTCAPHGHGAYPDPWGPCPPTCSLRLAVGYYRPAQSYHLSAARLETASTEPQSPDPPIHYPQTSRALQDTFTVTLAEAAKDLRGR